MHPSGPRNVGAEQGLSLWSLASGSGSCHYVVSGLPGLCAVRALHGAMLTADTQ